jgi:hypothetical protein
MPATQLAATIAHRIARYRPAGRRLPPAPCPVNSRSPCQSPTSRVTMRLLRSRRYAGSRTSCRDLRTRGHGCGAQTCLRAILTLRRPVGKKRGGARGGPFRVPPRPTCLVLELAFRTERKLALLRRPGSLWTWPGSRPGASGRLGGQQTAPASQGATPQGAGRRSSSE